MQNGKPTLHTRITQRMKSNIGKTTMDQAVPDKSPKMKPGTCTPDMLP